MIKVCLDSLRGETFFNHRTENEFIWSDTNVSGNFFPKRYRFIRYLEAPENFVYARIKPLIIKYLAYVEETFEFLLRKH